MSDIEGVIEKIRGLPSDRLAEVEDFVDFLSRKLRRDAALDRLLSIASGLEAIGAAPISEVQIAAEVKAVRNSRKRPSGSAGADRS